MVVKRKKNSIDYLSYLKLAGGLFLTTPLQLAFWKLDFSLFHAILITSSLYIISIIIGVLLLNYLENGNIAHSLKNQK